MMNTTKINKNDVKKLNNRQTVMIETINTKGKIETNVYLGNFTRRSDAYYNCYVKGEFKPIYKGETTKSYRLLKLFRTLKEVSETEMKVNWLKLEDYKPDPVKAESTEAEEPVAEPETENVEAKAETKKGSSKKAKTEKAKTEVEVETVDGDMPEA